MSMARTWKREWNQTYYVTLSGKQIPLGKDERESTAGMQQACATRGQRRNRRRARVD